MKALLIAIAIFWTAPLMAIEADEEAALTLVNQARQMAGLKNLRWHPKLGQAAAGHSRYLAQRGKVGHEQVYGTEGFTGELPADRAIQATYASRMVWENITAGPTSLDQAVVVLMSAIYHRFGFLRLDADQLGYASMSNEKQAYWVFLMGNQAVEERCLDPREEKPGEYYQGLCRGKDKVSAEDVDFAKNALIKSQPKSILWPPKGSRFVPPAFFDEIPNPMPGFEVTGYPISIQLNPGYYPEPELIRFELFRSGEFQPLRTQLLTERRDPHQKFAPGQFALFPFERLDWGESYRVEARFVSRGEKLEFNWHFSVKKGPKPLYHLQGEGEDYWQRSGDTHYYYLPPTSKLQSIPELTWEGPEGMKVEMEQWDKNTLKLKITGKSCDLLKVRFLELRGFLVRVQPEVESEKCD